MINTRAWEGTPKEHRAKQRWPRETHSVTYVPGLSTLSGLRSIVAQPPPSFLCCLRPPSPIITNILLFKKDYRKILHPEGNTLSDISITREDIIDAIKTISQNSSGGPDEFPAILLKQCSKSLSHPLQLLYKASLKTGEMPTDLKRAIITPIYKGGSRNLPKNNRPVALTSHLIKILEKILAKISTNSWKCIRK